eukprot:TRINITY_DN73540_c0_g1_i1.p1 TRINITY_DN73540_c0_g1~~TRINITY_DN73540_c0_g1_i1.p1  ORF type:complete len:538 (-),score=112.85 TRINITY_DN73540_c0_g1_i1:72-1622(-)
MEADVTAASPGDLEAPLSLMFMKQRSEPSLGSRAIVRTAGKQVPGMVSIRQLPPLVENSHKTSWRDAHGKWHHGSAPDPYVRDIRQKCRRLPRVLSKVMDGRHRVPTPPRVPPNQSVQSVRSSARSGSPEPAERVRPESEPHGGRGIGRRKASRERKQEQDRRLLMLQQLLREEDEGIDAPTSIFSSRGGSRRSRPSSRSAVLSSEPQHRPGLPAPRPNDWERVDRLSKPRPMLAEGRLAEVLGQHAAAEAMAGAEEAGIVPGRPKKRAHIPAIPPRLQERWDNTPPVGRALEEFQWNQPKTDAPAKKPKAKEPASSAPTVDSKPKAKESTSNAPAGGRHPGAGSPPKSSGQTTKLSDKEAAPSSSEASKRKPPKADAAASSRGAVSPGQTMKMTQASEDGSPRSHSSYSYSERSRSASSRTKSVSGPDDHTVGPETESAGYAETIEGYNTNTFEGDSENDYRDDDDEIAVGKSSKEDSSDAAHSDKDEGLVATIKADENNAAAEGSYSGFEPESP